MPEQHLREYVWMAPPFGGEPEKVAATDADEINRRMVAGWKQVFPEGEEA